MFKIKLIIGFITYEDITAKYLPYFLESIKKQTFQDFKIIVIDNSKNKENANAHFIKNNYSKIDFWWAEKNLGFSKAYNIIIEKAVKEEAEFFLMLNPDMILEKDSIEKLIEGMEKEKDLASVSPKILRWDFKNNKKTNIIDTLGIKLISGLKFVDLKQGERDEKKIDNFEILGPSGAAGMFRINALKKVSFLKNKDSKKKEYFDELMFMYKEDCDLVYRFFLVGLKSKCISNSVFYHDRTASGTGGGILKIILNRKNKSKKTKEWSFLNQHIIYLKYWKVQNLKNKLIILKDVFEMFIFSIFFEQYLLKQYKIILKIKKDYY